MKKTLFILFFTVASIGVKSQDFEAKRFNLGLYVTPLGANDLIRFTSLEGAETYEDEGYFGVGIQSLIYIKDNAALEFGFNYTRNSFQLIPNLSPLNDFVAFDTQVDNYYISAGLRAYLKYGLYFRPGINIGVSTSGEDAASSQVGLGGSMGFGYEYRFNNQHRIYIEPQANLHAVISASGESYPERLFTAGIRLGYFIGL